MDCPTTDFIYEKFSIYIPQIFQSIDEKEIAEIFGFLGLVENIILKPRNINGRWYNSAQIYFNFRMNSQKAQEFYNELMTRSDAVHLYYKGSNNSSYWLVLKNNRVNPRAPNQRKPRIVLQAQEPNIETLPIEKVYEDTKAEQEIAEQDRLEDKYEDVGDKDYDEDVDENYDEEEYEDDNGKIQECGDELVEYFGEEVRLKTSYFNYLVNCVQRYNAMKQLFNEVENNLV